MIAAYYRLTKPGIVYGNALSAIGGFLLASKGRVDLALFAAMLLGISLVIASACVANNYIDRGIDAKMKRTQKRALVTGEIPGSAAIIYAIVLGLVGLWLITRTNLLTTGLALLGMFVYIVLYALSKRRSPAGTLVGSISGAVPIVVGYCAVTNRFDLGALLLFIIMALWQMPHFYAIAMYRSAEYRQAGIPVLPLARGRQAARRSIVFYIVFYVVAGALLTAAGYTGITYLSVMLLLGAWWLWRGLQGLNAHGDDRWARRMFGLSLVVLLGFCVMISFNAWLP